MIAGGWEDKTWHDKLETDDAEYRHCSAYQAWETASCISIWRTGVGFELVLGVQRNMDSFLEWLIVCINLTIICMFESKDIVVRINFTFKWCCKHYLEFYCRNHEQTRIWQHLTIIQSVLNINKSNDVWLECDTQEPYYWEDEIAIDTCSKLPYPKMEGRVVLFKLPQPATPQTLLSTCIIECNLPLFLPSSS